MTTKQANIGNMQAGYGRKRKIANIAVYIILSIMVLIWIFPIVWLVLQLFNGVKVVSIATLFSKKWTFVTHCTLFR